MISQCPRRQIYSANQNISIIHVWSPKDVAFVWALMWFYWASRFQSTGTIRKKKPETDNTMLSPLSLRLRRFLSIVSVLSILISIINTPLHLDPSISSLWFRFRLLFPCYFIYWFSLLSANQTSSSPRISAAATSTSPSPPSFTATHAAWADGRGYATYWSKVLDPYFSIWFQILSFFS